MPLPWAIHIHGQPVARGSLAECIAAGVERGVIDVEIRIAAKTGERMEKHVPARGVVIVPVKRRG
jgi:hypothetical protein